MLPSESSALAARGHFSQGHVMTDMGLSKAQLLEELAESRRSEEKWRSLAANAPIFIAIVDREGVIQFLNRTQPGHSIKDAIGKRIYEYIDPEYHDVARASVAKVFSTGDTTSYETLAAGPTGTKAWYETNLGPVKHGEKIVAVSLFSTDISARKEAEASLRDARDTLEQRVEERTCDVVIANELLQREIDNRRQSEERYRSLVETTSDWVWEVDDRGVYTHVSPRVMDLLGYTPEEVVGKTPFDLMLPDEAERVAKLFRSLVERREAISALENTNVHQTGRPVVLETTAVPFFGRDGDLLGYRGMDRDITERKAAEEALRKEHRVLKQLLRAQDRERQITVYEIHDGLAQKLTAAIMQFQLFDRIRYEVSEDASKAGNTVHELLDQCLAEARHLINGMRPPILDEYGVVPAIDHLTCDSSDHTHMAISFHNNVQFDRLEPVLENSIYRIVQESLSNACCHSKSDRVQIDLTQHDHRVQIAVQDWGIGFDPNHTEEECFGLAGIRERARLLGGQVQVDTKLGKGTRIAVDLPIEVEELDS